MAYNFPPNPTLNQIYSYNGRVFSWNGVQWAAISAATSTAVPVLVSATAPQLPKVGELWYNTNNQVLYIAIRNRDNLVEWTALTHTQIPPASVFDSVTPPLDPQEGELWYNPSNFELRVWTVGPSGSSWVLVSSGSPLPCTNKAPVIISSTPPANPLPGSLWYNNTNSDFNIWYTDLAGGQWISVVPYPTSNAVDDRGGIFYGPIYGQYQIPDNPEAFITVGWFEDNTTDFLNYDLLTGPGALITATADGTPATLTVGADGTFLKADPSLDKGIGWSNLVDCGDY